MDQPKDDTHWRIDAEVLIPGRGTPIRDATLVFSNAKISWVGARADLSQEHQSLDPFHVPVLMPGMWDCHVHYYGANRFAVDAFVSTPAVIAGVRAARDMAATLNAGFTSVRELAGYGVELSQVVGEGWVPGPTIYSAVSVLSQTAGHGDARGLATSAFADKIAHGFPAQTCDGAAECLKAVRTQVRRGAAVIKVATSGGIISEGDDIETQQFDEDELRTIVKEATRNKLLVAAHCHGASGIKAAIQAGCGTIEHGTFLDDDLIRLMLDNDAILVATRGMTEFTASNPSALSPEKYQQALKARKHHAEAYAKAIKAGVRCAIGTDLGVDGIDQVYRHGTNGGEFRYAVEAGMSPLQAIEAGTANGPATLGPKGPRSGQLRQGYDADFIGLSQNPLDDIEVLAAPEKILHVWKGGKLYKRNGGSIGILDHPYEGLP